MFTPDNPMVIDLDPGAASFKLFQEADKNSQPDTDLHFTVNGHKVVCKTGEKRTTWQMNGLGIPKATLNNLICGTEIKAEAYEKYGVEGSPKVSSDVEGGKKKDKKGKKEKPEKEGKKPEKGGKKQKEDTESTLLVTQSQLQAKYPVEALKTVLEFKQFGKKKERKAIYAAFPKKKAKGEDIVATMEEEFSKPPKPADTHSIFEMLGKEL